MSDSNQKGDNASSVRHPFSEVNPAYSQAKAKLLDAKANKANQQVESEKSNSEMRLDLAKEIKSVFGKLNISVFAIVAILALIDVVLIATGKEVTKDRLISEKIILALIAGTVAQAGAAFVAIVGYLFPKKRSTKEGAPVEKSTTSVALGFIGGIGLGLFLGMISVISPSTSKTATPEISLPSTPTSGSGQQGTQALPTQLASAKSCDSPSTAITVVQSFDGAIGQLPTTQNSHRQRIQAPSVPPPKTNCVVGQDQGQSVSTP